ncbi:MAG: prepilin-type N-terminal cleavage/methylation domain-containing protein [Candidatus Latescibacteria bacterium]|nr:prepilin-type N-terminal cleavage/methylation domain-containing protein [Candidatus Latescibacterota bacterium]
MSARLEAGFTLTELIVMISIIGILAWLAFPNMGAMDEIRLDAAARRLAADLRYAQSQAISRRVMHGILFEPSIERYTVFAPTASTPVTDPGDRARPLRVDYASRTEFQRVEIASATFGTTPGVKFDYFGVPRDTAGTDLAATGRVILTYQGASDTIDVSPQTGTVTIR